MKKFGIVLVGVLCATMLSSCERDAGKLPDIAFKTGSGYISTNVSLIRGSNFKIGIDAAKTENRDVLKQFNISRSVNGATATTVFSQSLSGAEGDNYSYDYNATLDTTVGQTNKYTFTVTNRDGLVNQVSLTTTTTQ
jgi:hypothetical protein